MRGEVINSLRGITEINYYYVIRSLFSDADGSQQVVLGHRLALRSSSPTCPSPSPPFIRTQYPSSPRAFHSNKT